MQVVDYLVGFDEVGGSLECDTAALADRLAAAGVLHPNDRASYIKAGRGGGGGGSSQAPKGRSVRSSTLNKQTGSDEDSDFD